MPKKKEIFITQKQLIQIVVMILLYILLGNISEIQANPFVPGAIVAVNMIIIVLAGILFGRKVGFGVGLIGTFGNALTPAGNAFEFAAILPHAIMGYTAGNLREDKKSIFTSSLSILLGHILNIISFLLFGLFAIENLQGSKFWIGLGYESVFGIITINLLAWLYLTILHTKPPQK